MLQSILTPLIGGLLIGLASWLLLASLGRVAGISGITATAIAPSETDSGDTAWRWVFIAGLMIGGALANIAFPVPAQSTRPVWLLIVAGLIVGYGTIVGSGCTSGHGVCGLGRRSMRSLVATCTFMGTGFATVFVMNAIAGKATL